MTWKDKLEIGLKDDAPFRRGRGPPGYGWYLSPHGRAKRRSPPAATETVRDKFHGPQHAAPVLASPGAVVSLPGEPSCAKVPDAGWPDFGKSGPGAESGL